MNRILYIGNKLSRTGRTVTTIDTLTPLLEQLGYRVRTASHFSNKLLRSFDMLWRTASSLRWAQVVLIDTYSTQNFWYAVFVARLCQLCQVKYIPILHGGNLPQRLHTHPQTTSLFLSKAYQVVCPSAYLCDAFAKANFNNFQLIPNSIDLKNYLFTKREKLKPKLLWVRSFDQVYHPEMALEVLETIQQRYPEASLTMVGPEKDGSLQRCQQIAAFKNLNVQFTGLMSKSEWIALSATHDIFINTSRTDNLPVSIIEAMALGLPVVSTNVGGISYMIDHLATGVLVEQGAADEMALAIEQLLNDQKLVMQLTQMALESVRKYDWSNIQGEWKRLLQ